MSIIILIFLYRSFIPMVSVSQETHDFRNTPRVNNLRSKRNDQNVTSERPLYRPFSGGTTNHRARRSLVRNDRKTSVLTIIARERGKREKDTERNAKIDTHVNLDQLQPAGELSTARETAAEIATDDTPAAGIASDRQRAIAPYEGGRYVRGYEGRGTLGRK